MPRKKDHKTRPSVSIIGFGRLGQALAIALRSADYPILAVVARRAAKARKGLLSLRRDNSAVALSADQLEQLPTTDLILIATPDDVIEETARRLAAIEIGRTKLARTRRRTVLHTSGALSSEVLSPLKQVGFHTGSLHPLVSVSEARAGAKALREAFYCLEGELAAMRVARLIVHDLEGTGFSIPSERKALYHAAAVMASPHVIALFDLATEMLSACGLSRKRAREALLPLLESTVNNLMVSDPAKALTGTFARGDLATVKKHLVALSELSRDGHDEALEVYRLLGLHSLKLAEKNKLDPQLLEQIRKLLN
ncbi:MAG: DUF2520 domain-containing protein [Acidobacteriota bacterium]|nr:DUF2520 domain-containing protein [Acidobacteriota bacterium]